jgi:hypothetical protein
MREVTERFHSFGTRGEITYFILENDADADCRIICLRCMEMNALGRQGFVPVTKGEFAGNPKEWLFELTCPNCGETVGHLDIETQALFVKCVQLA